jgi:acyl-CoA synthetase (AMP-forming)/AMP-acid ligase II
MIYKAPYPDIDLPRVPLTHYFLERISSFGDKEALVDPVTGKTYTYNMLAQYIRNTAAALSRRGLKKGDVFAVYSPNHVNYPILFHAVSLIGGTVTTANPLSQVKDLKHQLEDAGAKYLVTVSPLLDAARQAAPGNVREIFTFDDSDVTPFSQLLHDEGSVPQVDIDSEDIVVLPYSSGTTGFPKGVMLTHFNVLSNILQMEGVPDFNIVGMNDRVIGLLPFFHIYGMVVIMNAALMRGATIFVMAKFDLVPFLEIIQKYRITRCCVVPPIMVALAKHPAVANYDTSSLIELMSGAAPLSSDLAEEVGKRLKCDVMQGYGMTETSPVTHLYNRGIVPGKKLGSVGQPVPNTEVKIVDTQSGAMLGPGQRGEVCMRGPQVMKGYLNNPEATSATVDADGWIHTGDIGYADEDGLFYIVDRVKELIKFKGFQVPPAELEALLLTHPAIADAAVIPSPDEEAGEVPKAFIVKKAGAEISVDEIMTWVSDRTSPQKKIRKAEFIDAIPKTASGKILRRTLVERDRVKNE